MQVIQVKWILTVAKVKSIYPAQQLERQPQQLINKKWKFHLFENLTF